MTTLIRVGHSAYRGTNAMRMCFSKAQAVRVLRNRGVKRDDARKAVSKALADDGATIRGNHYEVIEIVNEDFGLRNGHFLRSYSDMRKLWSSASEL